MVADAHEKNTLLRWAMKEARMQNSRARKEMEVETTLWYLYLYRGVACWGLN